MSTLTDIAVNRFLEPSPPKAAQLIVSMYGDIVEPRGGVLWMGNLINLCAGFGVNESLVRTAVSRLVSKGQLEGQREGRRSYYALTETARREYHAASDLFYGKPDGECDWIICHCPRIKDQTTLRRHGFAQLGGNVYAGADRPGRPQLGTVFRSELLSPVNGDLKEFVSSSFGLKALAADYSAFVSRFSPMKAETANMDAGETALLFRVALVHAYRIIRFRDPRLPTSVLPSDWPGSAARELFAEIYTKLSVPSDAYIGEQFLSRNGTLPACPESVSARLKTLTSGSER